MNRKLELYFVHMLQWHDSYTNLAGNIGGFLNLGSYVILQKNLKTPVSDLF